MVNNITGLLRNTVDKFYTQPYIVDFCMKMLKKHVCISSSDLCIEPSAGDGKFIKSIKNMFDNYIFYDIKPEHPDIIKSDFLLIDTNLFTKYEKIHVVGNPPFGRKSSLAIRFIKKSCSFADTVSFILPRSFKKQSMYRCFPPNFHLIYEYILPHNSFIINNISYNVPTVFQIWVRKDKIRSIPKKIVTLGYKFVKYEDGPHVSIKRVGYNAGLVDSNVNKNISSHYFIRFDKYRRNIVDKMNNVKFKTRNDTVGAMSISKQEMSKEYNKILAMYSR